MLNTPWNRVITKMGMTQAELARLLQCSRSTITKGKQRVPGLIAGHHQRILVDEAKRRGIKLTIEDFLP